MRVCDLTVCERRFLLLPPEEEDDEFKGLNPRLAIRAKFACARVFLLRLLSPCETETPLAVNLPRFAGLILIPDLRRAIRPLIEG